MFDFYWYWSLYVCLCFIFTNIYPITSVSVCVILIFMQDLFIILLFLFYSDLHAVSFSFYILTHYDFNALSFMFHSVCLNFFQAVILTCQLWKIYIITDYYHDFHTVSPIFYKFCLRIIFILFYRSCSFFIFCYFPIFCSVRLTMIWMHMFFPSFLYYLF